MTPVRITAVAAGGDGLGRTDDGQVVFCRGALPGELVVVDVVEEHRDYLRARPVALLETSAARVAPPCPSVAAGCGGCQWQHVAPAAALELKADIVRDALRRIGREPDAVVNAKAGVPLAGFRTTLRMAVDSEGRPAYRKWHTHDPLAVESCLVAHPLLEDLVTSARFPGATEVLLRVSASTGERIAAPDRDARRARVPSGTRVVGRGRPAAIREEVAGRSWRVSAQSFFQSGPAAATLLVESVRQAVGERAGRVVDLYAGVGVLGGSLADCGSLVAVESGASAVGDARANLRGPAVRIVHGDVAGFVRAADLLATDVVIADPPRAGLGRAGVATVVGLNAPVVVLVSCDAASLARDARLLREHDYRLDGVQVLDLFPGTFHVESVTKFVNPSNVTSSNRQSVRR